MAQLTDFRRYRPANENGADPAESFDVSGTDAGLDVSRSNECDVRRALKLRADRAEVFGGGLFSEPAWDILLKLYAADLGGRAESISSVCAASGVPPSTALRWLQHLQGEGWIERSLDPDDGQFLIALSARSRMAMKRLFGHSPDQIPEFKWHLRIGRGL